MARPVVPDLNFLFALMLNAAFIAVIYRLGLRSLDCSVGERMCRLNYSGLALTIGGAVLL